MDLQNAMNRLTHQAVAIQSLVQEVPVEQARWKPTPERWSILEVINHLYDEEREDFRARLDLLLNDPEASWTPNDPQAWVVERSYNTRDLTESINRFRTERRRSLAWFKILRTPDWSRVYSHPMGDLRADTLLACWVAHDLLHIRQLARLHFDYVAQQAAPHTVDYAGKW